eukprot:1160144-Pelagomonas_calceolata.AAC.3
MQVPDVRGAKNLWAPECRTLTNLHNCNPAAAGSRSGSEADAQQRDIPGQDFHTSIFHLTENHDSLI